MWSNDRKKNFSLKSNIVYKSFTSIINKEIVKTHVKWLDVFGANRRKKNQFYTIRIYYHLEHAGPRQFEHGSEKKT